MAATGKNSAKRVWRWAKATALGVSLVLSALLVAVAAASPDARWVAWIGLLPLFAAIRVLPPVRAALSGAVWGGSLYAALSASGATPDISSGPLALALLTIVPAAYAGFGSLLTRARGFKPITLALGWIAVEVALQPVGLHGGLLAGTQGGGAGFEWVTRVLGYAFVAFLVVCINASLLAVLSRAHLRIPPQRLLQELRDSERCPSSQTLVYVQSWVLRQAYPRGPPVPVAP